MTPLLCKESPTKVTESTNEEALRSIAQRLSAAYSGR